MISQNTCVRILALGLSILTFSPQGFAQSRNAALSELALLAASDANTLDALTHNLRTPRQQLLSAFSRQSPHLWSPQQSAGEDALFAVAKARHELLTALIEEHPEEVLRTATSSAVRSTFPPAVQAYIEEEVEREGELATFIEDREDGSSRLHYLLTTGDMQFSLHFAGKQSKRFLTGSRVRVKGVQLGNAIALASDRTGVQTLARASSSASREQRALVMLVNFQGNSAEQPVTVQFVKQVIDKTDQFFQENSNGQTRLTSDVFGWHTLPISSAGCDYNRIALLARQAAANAGFELSAYNRYIYGFPRITCGWSGFGTVGGAPAHAWINGAFGQTTLSHELGHNLGLFHSHAYECGSTTLGDNCTTLEYGDYLDTMGFGSGHYNAFQKERLGWTLAATQVVQSDGVYILDSYETVPGPAPKVLKIPKSPGQWYYVEYRQPIGFDGFLLSNDNVRNGVVIHMGTETNGNSSYLLDMTPETNSWYDPALTVGRSFSDSAAGVTITPLWANITGAAVSVSLASQPCLHASPTITLSPMLNSTVLAGVPVSYTVSVKNNDGPTCPSSNFTLQANPPSTGWTVIFAAPIVALSPGVSASTVLTVTSPVSADEGIYTIKVKASRSAGAGIEALTSTTYTIDSLPAALEDVSVTTHKSSYVAGEWVKAIASIQQGGVSVHQAKVKFLVTSPDGQTRKKKLMTNKQGVAVFRFPLSRHDPSGLYHVKVQASQGAEGISTLTPASAETNFTVKKKSE